MKLKEGRLKGYPLFLISETINILGFKSSLTYFLEQRPGFDRLKLPLHANKKKRKLIWTKARIIEN